MKTIIITKDSEYVEATGDVWILKQTTFKANVLFSEARNKIIKTNGKDLCTGGGYLSTGGGSLYTEGGNLNTGGGYLSTGGGFLDTGGGFLDTGGGTLRTNGGTLMTKGGTLMTKGGSLSTGGGSLDTGGGTLNTGGGALRTKGGTLNTGGGYLILSLPCKWLFHVGARDLKIGCKLKTWDEWDTWFLGDEEYETPRDRDDFKMIKACYFVAREYKRLLGANETGVSL